MNHLWLGGLAFLAMAHHRLEEAAEAQRYLASLRRLMESPRRAEDVESLDFLREAEGSIEGTAEKQHDDSAPEGLAPDDGDLMD